MNAFVPIPRDARTFRQALRKATPFSLIGSELNGADGETQSGASINAEKDDWGALCFSFFASEMTGKQALRLMEQWHKIIREE